VLSLYHVLLLIERQKMHFTIFLAHMTTALMMKALTTYMTSVLGTDGAWLPGAPRDGLCA
jgi:hypothetical protein